MAAPRLIGALLVTRSVPNAVEFYSKGLGLRLLRSCDNSAELDAGGSLLTLSAATSEAALSTGYSPFLNFEVEDVPGLVSRLLPLGASLDGAINFEPHGTVASLRCPDGHMIGLFEPNLNSIKQ